MTIPIGEKLLMSVCSKKIRSNYLLKDRDNDDLPFEDDFQDRWDTNYESCSNILDDALICVEFKGPSNFRM